MYNNNLMILVSTTMKEQIKQKAQSEDKTVSDYVRGLIIEDIKRNR